jgi:hypothetical protein
MTGKSHFATVSYRLFSDPNPVGHDRQIERQLPPKAATLISGSPFIPAYD